MISATDWTALSSLPKDFLIAKELVYDKCNFNCTHLKAENESSDYGACTFSIHGLAVKFRAAKITPTKTGLFVAIWKRNENGQTEPFDAKDNFDLIIISTRTENNFGQFIFPKAILLDKEIISGNNKTGKRGIRVYPPWCHTTNKQAQKTQQWQSAYFLEMSSIHSIDLARAKKLLTR